MAKVTRDQKKLLKAIKKNPHNPAPIVELGWFYVENNQPNEARQQFVKAQELKGDPQIMADAAFGMATIASLAGHHAEARDLLREIIRECPNFKKRPEVHFELGRTNDLLWHATDPQKGKEQEREELLQRAIDHYQQAIERRSEQATVASVLLGKLYYDINRPEDAVTQFQRVVTDKTLERSYAIEINFLLGKISRAAQNDLPRAQSFFEDTLKLGPKADMQTELYCQLGDIARQQGNDDQAVERYEKALAAAKDEQLERMLNLLVNLGEIKQKHYWHKMAIDYGERALQIPNPPAELQKRLFALLAEGYYGIKAYQQAEEYAQKSVDLCKDGQEKAEGLLRLGEIYEHLNLTHKAADAYRKGLKFAARNYIASKLNGALGKTYMQEEKLNQAFKHFKEALEFVSDDDEHAASLYRLLGDCHLRRKETEPAIEMYGTVLAKYPNSKEEPYAREELKTFRKQFKQEMKAEDADIEELERLTELVNEILDEKGFFQRLKEGLAKTHLSLVGKIEALLAGRTEVDDDLIENLEEILILSDLGVATTQEVIASIQEKVKRKELENPAQLKVHLKREIQEILAGGEKAINLDQAKPYVILVIGVNGTGKTTTIGKLASKYKGLGKEVMLVAGDTFRAAAIEQLEIWGERAGCEVIKHTAGADPSAVMFDAIQAAKSRNVDVVLADTAGRLHTKKNLMEELKKMVRVIARELPGAPHEILMVVDATTGQNAISQAQLFNEGVGLSGIVLTKLDGTAKGGIIVSIAHDLKIPVTYIGIGEKLEDLREFHAKEFVEALFED